MADRIDDREPFDADWFELPANIRPAIQRYVLDGDLPTSGFIIAVLKNDLAGVMIGHAGSTRMALLIDLLHFLSDHAPPSSWGSSSKVANWIYLGGWHGRRRQLKEFNEAAERNPDAPR